MRGKVTIQEIADSVGLSKYAVSRALAGKSGVSAHSRELILKKAAELGYRKEPQAAAPIQRLESLDEGNRGEWTETVLVLFPDIRSQNPDSPYWGPLFEGITSALSLKGIGIVTLTRPDIHSLFSLLNPGAIMGVLAVGNVASPILHEARRLGKPVVMVDHWDQSFPCDTIFSDNLAGMAEIMTVMLSRGLREFQFIGNIAEAHSFYERWLGYTAALTSAGLPQSQLPSLLQLDYDSIGAAIEDAYATSALPEVFVCANDFYAHLAAHSMKELGRADEGVIFTGFDNTHPSELSATVNIDEETLGRRAVDQLLWRILNPTASYERKLIRGDLVVKS